MKRASILLLITLLALASLVSCGEKNPPAPLEPQETNFAFKTNGYEFKPGDDMADVLAKLGEPKTYFEAASCAFQGLDKVYTYVGFIVTTNPIDGKDIVCSIQLTDDSVTTQEGIYLGSTVADVKQAYGEPEGTSYSYKKGTTTIMFVIKDDSVISVEYV